VFPLEAFGFLLGLDAGTNAEIVDIWFPEDIEKYSTRVSVQPQYSWLVEALEHAHAQDLTILGDWHSHPYKKTDWAPEMDESVGPSPSDLKGQRTLAGITAIHETPKGRKFAKTHFWGPIARVETIVTNGLCKEK